MENNEKALELRICSNAVNICCTAKQVLEFLTNKFGINNTESLFDIKVILNELISNAVFHGNQNIEEKYVVLKIAMLQNDLVQIKILDEGQGFNYRSIVETNSQCEGWDSMSMKECGRGLGIVRTLGEDISFNEKGNEITVLYKLVR